MKIRKLVFSNINNLKDGPHVISFDEEPLNSAGIFAIVGPTGSGKSTILDVITLALFNRIPRLSKVSDGSIQKDGSIITHFAKRADAAITYQVGDRTFTSKWSIRIASSGKVQPYYMEILDEAGNIIAEKTAVPAKNESIIGLNYDQFIKSIILSQGDFSRFLKAKKDERSELLEKLTGSHVYRKVGKAAYDKNKEIRQKLDYQRSLLSEIDLLSEDAVKVLRVEKEDAKNEAIQIEENLKGRNNSRSFKLAINTLGQKIGVKNQELAKISKEIEVFKEDQVKLELHDKVSFLSGDLRLYENVKGNITKTESEKENYKKDLLKAKASLQETLMGLNDLTGNVVTEENFKEVLDVYESKVIELENQVINLHSKGSDTRSRIKQILADGSLAFNGRLKPELAIAQLLEEEERQVIIIGNHSVNLAESNLKLKALTGDLSVLNRLLLLYKSVNDALKDKKIQAQRVEKYVAEHEHNKVLLEKQKALALVLKDKYILLKKQKEDALKIAKLEDLRDQLIKGDPCPLCGSLDHPYQEHFFNSSISELDMNINENDQVIKKEDTSLRKLENIESELATGIKIGNRQIEEIQLKVVGIQENIDLEKKKYLGPADQIKSGISDLMAKLEIEMMELQHRIDATGKLVQIRALLKEFTQLKGIGESYSRAKFEKLSLYKGNDVKRDCNKLQDSFIHACTTIEKLTGFILEKEKSLCEYNVRLTGITTKLKQEMPKVGIHSIGEIAALILPENQRLKLSEKKKQLNDSHIVFKAELEQHEKELKEATVNDLIPEIHLDDLETLIQNEEVKRNNLNSKIGEITSQLKFNAENKKSKEEKQKGIKELEKDSEKWSLLDKMIGSAKGDKFANFAQDLTLRNLLVYTNIRLKDLTDRYLLDMPGANENLTVVDLYQGNTERAVTTLSGGEIFILSLALAISLSDMASQNIALESLFIDEGFGTLDQETLDVAMSTLEKLQSENRKMVGIISHVDALKERINVQIQLKKNAQGYSRIEIVS